MLQEPWSLLGSVPSAQCVPLTLLPSCVPRGLPAWPAFLGDRGGTHHTPICGLSGPFSGDPLICCRRGPQVSLSTQGSWDCVYISLRLGWDLPWQGEGRFPRQRERGAGEQGSGWPLEFPTGSCQQRQPLPLPPPTGRHTNFKSLITPDLGCFLTVASGAPAGEKAPVTFTFICKVWGEGPPPSFVWGREDETEQPIREAGCEGEKL